MNFLSVAGPLARSYVSFGGGCLFWCSIFVRLEVKVRGFNVFLAWKVLQAHHESLFVGVI